VIGWWSVAAKVKTFVGYLPAPAARAEALAPFFAYSGFCWGYGVLVFLIYSP
jgi:hypothetical protein